MGVKRYLLDLLSPNITFLAPYDDRIGKKVSFWVRTVAMVIGLA